METPSALGALETPICPDCGEPLTVEGSGGDEPQHVFCDLCGKAEHPADLTPDWNGETGNHKSCEREAAADEERFLMRDDHAAEMHEGDMARPSDCPICEEELAFFMRYGYERPQPRD